MAFTEIAGLLKAAIGLDPDTIGLSAVAHAAHERQRACDIHDPQTYSNLARASAEEFQALIEAVVVPETWFFRDPEAFAMLARVACAHLHTAGDRVLRLLSLPCSTGEEPYSMAIALLGAGVPPDRFRIDAVDVSRRARARAEDGVYGRNSFRGNDQAFRDRYLHRCAAEEGHYRVIDAVRACVRFRHGNLFDDALRASAERYDAIFCRNLLIYFDRETQDRATKVLEGLLAPDGVLFIGPSEAGLFLAHGFTPTPGPLAFGFRKVAAAPAPAKTSVAPPARPSWPARRPRLASPHGPPASPQPARATRPSQSDAVRDRAGDANLAAAMRLADEGQFGDAEALCESYLREHRPSASAFYLLGLVRDATGRMFEAESAYRKALYLDPNHYEALVHFALLVERHGHHHQARALRQRARRLEEKGRMSHDGR